MSLINVDEPVILVQRVITTVESFVVVKVLEKEDHCYLNDNRTAKIANYQVLVEVVVTEPVNLIKVEDDLFPKKVIL